MLWQWMLAVAIAYVVGSVPFGVMIGRLRGIDIRQHGSRNVGATNVARVLGKPLGITCFVLDLFKGAGPVLGAGVWFDLLGRPVVIEHAGQATLTQREMTLWLAVAIAAIFGHMFSVFLRFGGGKGVATGCGAMLAMWNLLTFPAIFAIVVWYTTLRLWKYVSLASVTAAVSLPIWCALYFVPHQIDTQPFGESLDQWLRAWPLYAVTFAVALLVVWRHRGNLARIRRGEEPKVGGRTRRGDFLQDRDRGDQRERSSRDADASDSHPEG